jgi:hypothetical protein
MSTLKSIFLRVSSSRISWVFYFEDWVLYSLGFAYFLMMIGPSPFLLAVRAICAPSGKVEP